MADLATIIEGPNASLQASSGVSVPIWCRVELQSTGLYSLAGANTTGEFVAAQPTPAAGGVFEARFNNATGTQIYANDANAIAVGDSIYALAAGLVSNTTTTGVFLGKARTAAAASTYVEVVREGLNSTPLTAETWTITAAALTDNTGGTPSTTLAAITAGASYAQADMVAVKNAIASLAAMVNKDTTDVSAGKTALTAMGLPLS